MHHWSASRISTGIVMGRALVLILVAVLSVAVLACSEAEEAAPPDTPGPSLSTSNATPSVSPSSTVTAIPDGWSVYEDPQLGFSFPYPSGLVATEQLYDQLDKSGNKSGQLRTLSFRHSNGTPAISVAIGPNPDSLNLEEWIRTFPGWPSEPQVVSIANEQGFLFEINQTGQRYPAVYFGHGGFIFSISGNVFGAAELRVSASPGITAEDFQRVRDGFRFVPNESPG